MEPLEVGTIFLFCGRKKNKIKCLAFEGDGFSLSVKRVTDGSFSWPKNEGEAMKLTWEQYDRLVTGFSILYMNLHEELVTFVNFTEMTLKDILPVMCTVHIRHLKRNMNQ